MVHCFYIVFRKNGAFFCTIKKTVHFSTMFLNIFRSDFLTTIEVIGSLIEAVLFAQEETALKKAKIKSDILTALTPTGERNRILSDHLNGKIEAVVSVGVLIEGWDNPNCNIIVHCRPTLS